MSSKALELIKKVNELGYYGQWNSYSEEPYQQDAGEVMRYQADLQLPDKSGPLPAIDNQQIRTDRRKSRGEDGVYAPNN